MLTELLDTGGPWPCVVVDEALEAAEDLVALAEQHRAAFCVSDANAFPGPELPLPANAVAALAQRFEPAYAQALGVGRCVDGHGRLSMVSLPPQRLRPLQRVCHRDRLALAPGERIVAGVIYLFADERLGGTSFFQPRQDAAATEALMRRLATASDAEADELLGGSRGYLVASNDHFRLCATAAPRWNRAVFYDGTQFHGSHVAQTELLNDDPRRGRLTLNLFLRYQPA